MNTPNRAAVRERIARAAGRAPAEIEDATALGELCPDSFQLVEVLVDLQEDLGVTLVQEDLRTTRSVGDLAALLAERCAAQALRATPR